MWVLGFGFSAWVIGEWWALGNPKGLLESLQKGRYGMFRETPHPGVEVKVYHFELDDLDLKITIWDLSFRSLDFEFVWNMFSRMPNAHGNSSKQHCPRYEYWDDSLDLSSAVFLQRHMCVRCS